MLRKQLLQMFLFLVFCTTNIILYPLLLFCYLSLYNSNRKLYRKICKYFCCLINTQVLLVMQWCSGAKLIIYTDKKNLEKYFGKEHALCIVNHRYSDDWIMPHMFSNAVGIVGNTKSFNKQSIQHVPLIGAFLKMSEHIFLKRNFKEDEQTIYKQIKNLTSSPYPLLIFLYPEGTRFSSLKHEVSMKFAAEKNLKPLKYHLQPRTKGFVCCLKAMKGHVPAIYNLQFVLCKNDEDKKPSAMLRGKPVTVHLYAERIPIDKLPETEDGQNEFLRELFTKKDKLLESFLTRGDFFETSGIERVDKFAMEGTSYWFFTPFVASAIICVPVFYYCAKYLLNSDLTYFGISLCVTVAAACVIAYRIFSEMNNKSSYGLN